MGIVFTHLQGKGGRSVWRCDLSALIWGRTGARGHGVSLDDHHRIPNFIFFPILEKKKRNSKVDVRKTRFGGGVGFSMYDRLCGPFFFFPFPARIPSH